MVNSLDLAFFLVLITELERKPTQERSSCATSCMVLIMTASPSALRAECGSGYYSIFIFEGTQAVSSTIRPLSI